jgi:hypothetical protein
MPTTDSNEELKKSIVNSLNLFKVSEDLKPGHYLIKDSPYITEKQLDDIVKALTTHIQAICEEVIGDDRRYEKYGECPSGCGMQYGCACDSAELRVKNEQRQRLAHYLGKDKEK